MATSLLINKAWREEGSELAGRLRDKWIGKKQVHPPFMNVYRQVMKGGHSHTLCILTGPLAVDLALKVVLTL